MIPAPAMRQQPSASYSLTIRIESPNLPGMLGRITTAIGEEHGDIGAIDIVHVHGGIMTRDITVACRDEAHGEAIVKRLQSLEQVHVKNVSDRTFLVHLGGKIEVVGKVQVKTRDDLSMVYTPGVARVCNAIKDDPSKMWSLTIKRNTVAVVTDGTAVLGLGNIGPAAATPVMEGKAMIFKAFAGVDAFPICLDTQDPDEIIETVVRIAPVFGGINLEDIAAPKCFYIEDQLRKRLDIPVMHDDQHGTAVVALAALTNALKLVGKQIDKIKIVINGSGASGVAVAKIFANAGAKNLVLCDTAGAIYRGREVNMNPVKEEIARTMNPENASGTVRDVLRGADVFVGLSAPGVVGPDDIRAMANDPIVFAMANPIPEVMPETIQGIARVIATGRSDYPNQINNSLGFPGIFRGALDVQATDINDEMKLAASHAIASLVADDELTEDYIIPTMFDKRVAEAVAEATREAAIRTGVARKSVS
ncbi:MAG: malate oxidoreductase [Dehalococcoidia bacterium]|nr:MAG: malate oxidoreductase [Dehalococcoidia bacterium]